MSLAAAITTTRELVLAERAPVLERLMLVSRGALDRTDALEQTSHNMRREGGAFVAALDRLDDLRNEAIAIGDACPGDICSPGPNTDQRCTRDGGRLCDYDRIGGRTIVPAGNVAFDILPLPAAGFSWWRPKLVRFFAIDTNNPSITRWEGIFFTNITVGQHPVEGFSAAPAAAVVAGVHAGDWVVPDNTGVPVGWPDISNAALSNQLTVSGIGLWAAGVAFNAFLTVLGNPLKEQGGPACRVNNGSLPPPRMPGSRALPGPM